MNHRWILFCCSTGYASLIAITQIAPAQSVIDRLSGFDEPRITVIADWPDQPDNEMLGNEAAKLIFQVNRLDRGGALAIDSQQLNHSAQNIGGIASVHGMTTSIDRWKLPQSLAEALEFDSVYRVGVLDQATSKPSLVLTSEIPTAWTDGKSKSDGFETSATGVVVRPSSDEAITIIAAATMKWFAAAGSGVSPDWAMLGARGFDVSLFDGVRNRDRQLLQSADSEAFYPLLNIAASLGESKNRLPTDIAPTPEPAADLLKDSAKMVGRFVRLDLNTVRLTRIAVSEEITKRQLGGDHYWQIDSIGDLGNVVIQIESKGHEAAVFENRYPVSIAVRDLPEFLRQAMSSKSGDDDVSTDVAMISRSITVDGIFFRLWSYESDFMDRHGGGNQFGPLVIASQISDAEPTGNNQSPVFWLGWYVAVFALLGIAAAVISGMFAAKRAAAAKRQQKTSSS